VPEFRDDAGEPVWRRHLASASVEASSYHAKRPRSELVDLLPGAPRTLLEIGCGSGLTGRLVKERFPGCRVIGIDINDAAVAAAGGILDQAIAGSIESLDLDAQGIAPGSLDAVIMGDVLEHLYNPWAVLERLRPYLAPGGALVVSIPNSRNLILIDELAGGDWRYQADGLLDVTHIRFFTLAGIRRLFAETGYQVAAVQSKPDDRLAEVQEIYTKSALKRLTLANVTLRNPTPEDVAELCTLQFLVVATVAVGA
jgi:trans-aconitate methyltransferase